MSDRAAAARDWAEIEAAQPGPWAELRRLIRRARRRWLLTLLLGLGATAAVLVVAARRPHYYESRIAFRVSEGAIDTDSAPRTNGRLRDYVAEVVFSNQRLLEVIKQHDLYPELMARDPSLALESMREDVEVEVWRNEFAAVHTADDPARSARLAVVFHGRNAEQVYAVVRQLGRLIIEHEQSSRLQQAEAALRLADDQAMQARELLMKRKRELVETAIARQRAATPSQALLRLMQERDLEKSLPRAELMLSKADRRREKAYLRLQLEKRALGLRFELTDAGRVEPEGMSKRLWLLIVGVVMFLAALPVCIIAVGAFDTRVYDLADVRRLGMETLGAVRPFAGDNAGALPERLRGGRGATMDAS